jgi:hypothetical protein
MVGLTPRRGLRFAWEFDSEFGQRMKLVRMLGGFGVVAPPVAACAVLAGGWMTPGYDPFARTISRLAEPGLPAAAIVELAICVVGVALLALAIAMGPGSRGGRALLVVASAGLLAAAAIRLDPESVRATTEHRFATTVAMLALAGAPFAFASSLRRRRGWGVYGRISFAVGAGELGILLAGLALLPTTFAEWGAWERSFLALPMGWMVLMSARLLSARTNEPMFSSTAENTSWAASVSADDNMKAAAASQRSSGS